MRLKGIIKSWNDERGFGFIEPLRGGPDVFFHITAFPEHLGRPQISQRVYFEVELGPEGKTRARYVEVFGHPRTDTDEAGRAPRGIGTLVLIPAFVLVYLIVGFTWAPPVWVAPIYVLVSVITFCVYASDKSKAQRRQWRTPEGTLHVLAIVGGWPGALLAQQLLRHKSTKAEFRSVFWGTVVLNLAAFLILCTPLGSVLFGTATGLK